MTNIPKGPEGESRNNSTERSKNWLSKNSAMVAEVGVGAGLGAWCLSLGEPLTAALFLAGGITWGLVHRSLDKYHRGE